MTPMAHGIAKFYIGIEQSGKILIFWNSLMNVDVEYLLNESLVLSTMCIAIYLQEPLARSEFILAWIFGGYSFS
jgi:hypothetical protein